MTVIGRKQQNYDDPHSNHASDTESLHLGSAPVSDSESVPEEIALRTRHCGPRYRRTPCLYTAKFAELNGLKRNSGKRKQRRYNNCCALQTLLEDDENDTSFVNLMDNYKSPLTVLLEDDDAMYYWNEFINMPEEEQEQLLEPFTNNKGNMFTNADIKTDNSSMRVSSRVKNSIKIKKNLPVDVVGKIETELIEFFTAMPEDIFVVTPSTSFDRLLWHAIARYHNLASLTTVLEHASRSVEISNNHKSWIPTSTRFSDYVEHLRQ